MGAHRTSRSSREDLRELHEAIGHERVAAIVDDFYERVQRHPTLAQPFARVKDWPEHKARVTHFWWLTLGGKRYREDRHRIGPVHMEVGVSEAQMLAWLRLFRETLASHLEPELAVAWYRRAQTMGRSLLMLASFDRSARDSELGRPAS